MIDVYFALVGGCLALVCVLCIMDVLCKKSAIAFWALLSFVPIANIGVLVFLGFFIIRDLVVKSISDEFARTKQPKF